jgi:hypothetical protein
MKKSDFLKKLRRTILISMPGGDLTEEKMEMIDTMADNIIETMSANDIKPPSWIEETEIELVNGTRIMTHGPRQRYGWEPE